MGQEPGGIHIEVMDVDGDGAINIVDALLIAQYSVGLIAVFPVDEPTAAPTWLPSISDPPTEVPSETPTPHPLADIEVTRTINFWVRQTGSVYTEAVGITNDSDTVLNLRNARLFPAEVLTFGSDLFLAMGVALDERYHINFPLTVPILDVSVIEASDGASFYLKHDGSLWVCGLNGIGHGDDSTAELALVPHRLMDSGIVDIACELMCSFAVKTDGSLWVWGSDAVGEPGTGSADIDVPYPVRVIDGGVVTVSVNFYHTVMLKSDGSLWVSGKDVLYNEETGTFSHANTFMRIIEGGVVKAVAGLNKTLALMEGGALWGFGYESLRAIPGAVQETGYQGWVIIESEGVADMDCGDSSSYWIKTDGSLWGCGSNDRGQLAQPELTTYEEPVRIFSSGVRQVSAGPQYALVLRAGEADAFGNSANLPVTIPPDQDYDFDVVFNAYREGDYSGVLTLSTDDTASPSIEIAITGNSRYETPAPTPFITPVPTGWGDISQTIEPEPVPTPVPTPDPIVPQGRYVVWQRMLGGSGIDTQSSISRASDGGYLVSGYTTSKDIEGCTYHDDVSSLYIVRFDHDGLVEKQSACGGNHGSMMFDSTETCDGGFIVAGHGASTDIEGCVNHGDNDMHIMKMDAEGNPQWQGMFGGSDYDTAYSIEQTPDGGYIVAGESSSADIEGCTNHGGPDCFLMKFDAEGNHVWADMLGGNRSDMVKSIVINDDNALILAGESGSTNIEGCTFKGDWDYYIVKYGPM